jgi:outer membrane murein-binding lipoprotein Lpp
MTAADAVLAASGTACLEAALLKRPMVICYRMGKWQFRLVKRMAYLPWVGLPNILLNELVVPELLQDEATPDALADALEHWLGNADACEALAERFAALHMELRRGTAERAAGVILSYLQGAAADAPETQAISSDAQEISSDTQEISSDTQEISSDTQAISSDTQVIFSDAQAVSPEAQEASPEVREWVPETQDWVPETLGWVPETREAVPEPPKTAPEPGANKDG